MSPKPAPVSRIVVLVSGKDDAVRESEVRRVVTELVGDDDPHLVVETFDGEEYSPGAIVEAASTPGFFTERRVVVARRVGRFGADDLAGLLAYLADPAEWASVVLVHDDTGRLSTKLSAAVKAHGTVIASGPPQAAAAAREWWTQQMAAAPVKLTARAGALIRDHLGDDAGRLEGLFDALADTLGAGATADAVDIEPLLGAKGAVKPWDLTDSIDRGDLPGALDALARLNGPGEMHPLAILALMSNHYGRMLRLDGANASTERAAAELLGLKGSTFPARKAMDGLSRLGSAGVARAVTLLAEADLDLKGRRSWGDTATSNDTVMQVLVARLSRLGGRTPARTRR